MIRELTISQILLELQEDNLLPTIVFRSSRSQCDADVHKAAQDGRLNLGKKEQSALKDLVFKLAERFDLDISLLCSHPHFEPLIQAGVGAHHAGQLLTWRLLLEEIMVAGQLRALFATGTVAAGVDFPARTVVITAHSKRGGDGYRNLTTSEFQQMSGRAGRRGKDTVGFCVVTPSRFCDAREVLTIADRPAEPLESSYYPSPSSVLNLLRYRNVDDLEYTIERSLASFKDRKAATVLLDEARDIDAQLSAPIEDRPKDKNWAAKRSKRARRLRREAEELSIRQRKLLEAALTGLRTLGYVDGVSLSQKGYWASNICTTLVLELSEIIEAGILDDPSPEKMIAVIASICGDEHRRYLKAPGVILKKEEKANIASVLKRVRSLNMPGTPSEASILEDAAHTALVWTNAKDWQEYRGLLILTGVHEGDAARLITQTAEHLGQIARLEETHPDLAHAADAARLKLLRPPLSEVIETI